MSIHTPDSLKIYVCFDHIGKIDTTQTHPDYKFNFYPSFKSHHCIYDGCKNEAYNVLIGIKIPSKISIFDLRKENIAVNEIVDEAMSCMEGGPAVDKLTNFLYFKVRIFSYDVGDYLAYQLLKGYAKLILRGLKINENSDLTIKEVRRILNKLNLLPEGYKL